MCTRYNRNRFASPATAPLMNVNTYRMSIRCPSPYLWFTLRLCSWMFNKNFSLWNVSELWDTILRWGLSTYFLLLLCQRSGCVHADQECCTFCDLFLPYFDISVKDIGLRNTLLRWKEKYLPNYQSVLFYVFVLYLTCVSSTCTFDSFCSSALGLLCGCVML